MRNTQRSHWRQWWARSALSALHGMHHANCTLGGGASAKHGAGVCVGAYPGSQGALARWCDSNWTTETHTTHPTPRIPHITQT